VNPSLPGATSAPGFAVTLAFVLLLTAAVPARAGTTPPIPITSDPGFLSDLSAPVLAPGGEGIVSYTLGDPLSVPISNVALTFELYLFSPAPGGSSAPVPSGAMELSTTNRTGASVVLSYPALPPRGSVPGSLGVAAGGGAPEGGYAVRTMLTFTANGSAYRFESRGYFSTATWEAATLPNGADGASQLNLSRLGVDGITPETAVGVHTDPWLVPILVLAGAGIVLAGIGGVYYFRWGPGSRSGANRPEAPQSAPSALGK